MGSQVWVGNAACQHRVDCFNHRKTEVSPVPRAAAGKLFVGAMMGMSPLDMVNAIESGIGGTLGFRRRLSVLALFSAK